MYLKHLLSLVLVRQICGGEECTFSDRTGHETTDWFKLGKEYVKAIYCHPAYLTYMQSTSCEMLGWMKHKLESRLLEKIWITSDMLMTPPYGQEPLDEGERGEWKSCLKTQHSKDKIMESNPITSWQIDGKTMQTVRDFYFGGLPNHCRWWPQPWNLKTLAPWNKSYEQPR